jgi:hypothetical protein
MQLQVDAKLQSSKIRRAATRLSTEAFPDLRDSGSVTVKWILGSSFLGDWFGLGFGKEGGAQNANWERFMQGLANKIVENGGTVGDKTSAVYHYPTVPTASRSIHNLAWAPKLIFGRHF